MQVENLYLICNLIMYNIGINLNRLLKWIKWADVGIKQSRNSAKLEIKISDQNIKINSYFCNL